MSRLFLLRHAKAIWAKPAMKDFDRPLAEEGISSLNQLAEAMRTSKLFRTRSCFLLPAARAKLHPV